MEDKVPSPFVQVEKKNEPSDIFNELRTLFEKHGYVEWGFYCSKEPGLYDSGANCVSDLMVQTLELTLTHMKKLLKEFRSKD